MWSPPLLTASALPTLPGSSGAWCGFSSSQRSPPCSPGAESDVGSGESPIKSSALGGRTPASHFPLRQLMDTVTRAWSEITDLFLLVVNRNQEANKRYSESNKSWTNYSTISFGQVKNDSDRIYNDDIMPYLRDERLSRNSKLDNDLLFKLTQIATILRCQIDRAKKEFEDNQKIREQVGMNWVHSEYTEKFDNCESLLCEYNTLLGNNLALHSGASDSSR
jgi:hypothetical protein